MITTSKYSGHKGPVLCLDVSSPSTSISSSSLLLSGSEDKTARIWDLRVTTGSTSNHDEELSSSSSSTSSTSCRRQRPPRASLCIPTQGEVLSAVFGAPSKSTSKSYTSSQLCHDHTIFLGVNNTVLEYDLRQHTKPIDDSSNVATTTTTNNFEFKSPIWIDPPTRDLSFRLQNEDEVNQICTMWCPILNANNGNNRGMKSIGKNNHKNSNKTKKIKNKKSKNIQQPADKNGAVDDCLGDEVFLLASCDDSGSVRVTTTTTIMTHQNSEDDKGTGKEQQEHDVSSHVLHHDPEGVAVVSSCAFRPLTTAQPHDVQLISGGMDCKIHLWDVSLSSSSSQKQLQQQHQQNQRIRKPMVTLSMQHQQQKSSTSQAVNPPMVHSLSWSPSGTYFASGLGSGDVNIYTVPVSSGNSKSNKRGHTIVQQVGMLSGVHDSSVVSVLYPQFGICTSDNSENRFSMMSDWILCSAGSDGKIMFWDLGPCIRGGADDLDAVLADLDKTTINRSTDDKIGYDDVDNLVFKAFDKSFLLDDKNRNDADYHTNHTKNGNPTPSLLFQIDHNEKINWVTRAVNDTIFVADTTNFITSYTIPLASQDN